MHPPAPPLPPFDRRWLVPALVAATLMVCAAPAPAAACAEQKARFDTALRGGDPTAVARAADAVLDNPFCDEEGRIHKRVARATATALAGNARSLPAAGEAAALEAALRYDRPWPLVARLGRLRYDARDFSTAQRLLEEALTIMDDKGLTEAAPSAAEVRVVHALAVQARQLAPAPQPSPRSRAGTASGLALGSVRGHEVAAAPVPVRFVYDSAAFTPEGRADAAFLRNYLRDIGDPAIILVGHTDHKGEDGYNCALSWRRVAALADALKAGGYRGTIGLRGMGERQPMDVYDPDQLTDEDLRQLNRRVEFFENNALPEAANACPRPN